MAMAADESKQLYWLSTILVLLGVLGTQNGVNGHEITVTKSISFPEFSMSVNPRITHDVKLLGSARLSDDKRSIQIPDSSDSDDIRHQAGRAIYSSPIRVFDPDTQTPASFDTTFSFQFDNYTLPSSHDANATREAHGGNNFKNLFFPVCG